MTSRTYYGSEHKFTARGTESNIYLKAGLDETLVIDDDLVITGTLSVGGGSGGQGINLEGKEIGIGDCATTDNVVIKGENIKIGNTCSVRAIIDTVENVDVISTNTTVVGNKMLVNTKYANIGNVSTDEVILEANIVRVGTALTTETVYVKPTNDLFLGDDASKRIDIDAVNNVNIRAENLIVEMAKTDFSSSSMNLVATSMNVNSYTINIGNTATNEVNLEANVVRVGIPLTTETVYVKPANDLFLGDEVSKRVDIHAVNNVNVRAENLIVEMAKTDFGSTLMNLVATSMNVNSYTINIGNTATSWINARSNNMNLSTEHFLLKGNGDATSTITIGDASTLTHVEGGVLELTSPVKISTDTDNLYINANTTSMNSINTSVRGNVVILNSEETIASFSNSTLYANTVDVAGVWTPVTSDYNSYWTSIMEGYYCCVTQPSTSTSNPAHFGYTVMGGFNNYIVRITDNDMAQSVEITDMYQSDKLNYFYNQCANDGLDTIVFACSTLNGKNLYAIGLDNAWTGKFNGTGDSFVRPLYTESGGSWYFKEATDLKFIDEEAIFALTDSLGYIYYSLDRGYTWEDFDTGSGLVKHFPTPFSLNEFGEAHLVFAYNPNNSKLFIAGVTKTSPVMRVYRGVFPIGSWTLDSDTGYNGYFISGHYCPVFKKIFFGGGKYGTKQYPRIYSGTTSNILDNYYEIRGQGYVTYIDDYYPTPTVSCFLSIAEFNICLAGVGNVIYFTGDGSSWYYFATIPQTTIGRLKKMSYDAVKHRIMISAQNLYGYIQLPSNWTYHSVKIGDAQGTGSNVFIDGIQTTINSQDLMIRSSNINFQYINGTPRPVSWLVDNFTLSANNVLFNVENKTEINGLNMFLGNSATVNINIGNEFSTEKIHMNSTTSTNIVSPTVSITHTNMTTTGTNTVIEGNNIKIGTGTTQSNIVIGKSDGKFVNLEAYDIYIGNTGGVSNIVIGKNGTSNLTVHSGNILVGNSTTSTIHMGKSSASGVYLHGTDIYLDASASIFVKGYNYGMGARLASSTAFSGSFNPVWSIWNNENTAVTLQSSDKQVRLNWTGHFCAILTFDGLSNSLGMSVSINLEQHASGGTTIRDSGQMNLSLGFEWFGNIRVLAGSCDSNDYLLTVGNVFSGTSPSSSTNWRIYVFRIIS